MWDGRRWEEDGPGTSDQEPLCTRLEIQSSGKGKGKVRGWFNGHAYEETERGGTFFCRVEWDALVVVGQIWTPQSENRLSPSLHLALGVVSAELVLARRLPEATYSTCCFSPLPRRLSPFKRVWWAFISNAMTWREVQQNKTKKHSTEPSANSPLKWDGAILSMAAYPGRT